MQRCLVAAALLVVSLCALAAQAPMPAGTTAEEMQLYSAFRTWITSQPPEVHQAGDDEIWARYSAELRAHGKSDAEITATISSLKRVGDKAEVEMWNRVLTSPNPMFNTAPNAFLASVINGIKPGRSLDVGMGQGRNTIYLAQQGWESAGFDPADRAVAAAQAQASQLGVKITTTVARADDFDWGEGRWDLIVLCYVGAREFSAKTVRALRPGGMVVVEGFHRDATKAGPIGESVVFDTNELLHIFSTLRVVRYEDTDANADFGRGQSRVVRLAAVKP